ncbi:MAG: TonB-dependent receptor family protein [Fusobacteriaceae bacterium]
MKKLLLIAAFIAVSTSAISINTEDAVAYSTVKLDDSIISESNFETDVVSTPKNVTIITKEEIKEKGAKTVGEALKSAPGITVKTLTGGEPSFDMRGQGPNAKSNVLVLLDGSPLNSIDMSGYKTNHIAIDSIERIEIIPGGGGVLYGDGAVAGMINIISKRPENMTNYGSVGMEAGSYDFFKYNVNYGTKINDKLFFKVDYTDKNSNAYRDYAESDMGSFSTSWLYLMDDSSIDFKYSHSKEDFKMPGALWRSDINKDREQSKYSKRSYGENENDVFNLKYTTNLTKNLEFITYADYTTQDYNSKYPFYKSQYAYDTEQFYIKPQLKYNYTKNNYFVVGGDYLDGKTDIKNDSITRKKESEGAFVINRFYLDKFQFTQGYRMQNIDLDYAENGDKENKNLKEDSKEFSINYLYSDTGSVFFNYLSAFRTPNTDELGYWEGDIEAQNSDTFEIGTKDMIGNTFYSISTFFTKTDNEIVYTTTPNNRDRNFNLDGKTERKGVELFLEHYFDKITVRESYTYTNAEITSGKYDGSEMPGVPEHKATLGATYSVTNDFKVNSDLNYVGKAYDSSDFNNEYGKTNSFVTVDLNVNYAYDPTLNIYGGINNLFDREYYEYVGGGTNWDSTGSREQFYYPANGRNFFVGFRKSF